MANSVDPDQTAPIGAVWSGSTLFASILNLSVMLGIHLQQTTFSDAFFFLGALRVNDRYHGGPISFLFHQNAAYGAILFTTSRSF